ncbi:MAG: hypothetical protein SCI25_03490 [Desulfuromonadales bacterium]|nr:hypothetical protein [Desulfuromonadales bacterium]MDW7757290.1 hypothetical protein [Desulfuromonadales bacterium]
MKKEHALEAVKTIEMMFARDYPRAARERLAQDLEGEAAEDARDALKTLERTFTSQPAPIVFLRMVREAGAARADRQQAQRTRERFTPGDPDSYKVFQSMHRLFFSGKATRAQILQKIKEVDRMKPTAGWATCGQSLADYYQRKGMDLTSAPGAAISHRVGEA